jgi:DNA mismatch repair ATPase MutL
MCLLDVETTRRLVAGSVITSVPCVVKELVE